MIRYLLEDCSTGEVVELDACCRSEAVSTARALCIMHYTTMQLEASDGFSQTFRPWETET